jgi:PAS domain S-box-containing protein
LRLLDSLLSAQGYGVRLAPSGGLALAAIQQRLPDLILLDIRMPKMDGYEVCQRLKADASTCDIPVIFLSALQEGHDKARAFEVGGSDYITKPLQAEEVVARVQYQIRLLELQQHLQQQQDRLLEQNQQLQAEIEHRKRIESELYQEKTLLSSLMNAIPDLIFFKNEQGQYIFWNQAFERFTGLPPEAIRWRTGADVFSLQDTEQLQSHDAQVLRTGKPLRREDWATSSNQDRRLLDTYKIAVQGPNGDRLGLIGIGRDITDRRAAEDYLNRTTSRLATLLANLQTGILVENEHRAIVLANQSFCDLFGIGLEPKGLLGLDCGHLATQSASIFVEPDRAIQRIDELLEQQKTVLGEELMLADGRIVERDYVPIISDHHFQGHLWQYRDITRRKANEQALVTTTQTLADFSHNLKQIHRLNIKHFDSFEDLFEDYLNTGCQILNFPGGAVGSLQGQDYVVEAIQPEPGALYPSYRCDADITLCQRAIQTRKTITYAHLGGLPDMQDHPIYKALGWESFISTPILVDDRVYGSLCFFSEHPRAQKFVNHEHEIIELLAQSIGKFIRSHELELERQTFQNELQQARDMADAANLAKSKFLANMSHELRTPLNTILGFTQLILREEQLDVTTQNHLDIVNRSGKHLLTLINDVLEMSKVEAGKLVLHSQSFNLRGLLRNLVDMFSLGAKANHSAIVLDCTPGVPVYIEADERKLRQVLINLMGNAVKFTQRGQVVLRVAATPTPGAEADRLAAPESSQSFPTVLSFEIEDSGPGLAPEAVPHLFEPFVQTEAGYRTQEGTGLGLPISQRFVQLMGGTIQVQTTLGQGSTFAFAIEVVAVPSLANPAYDGGPQTVERLALDQPSYRVLVVEDDPSHRWLLVKILDSAGFMVQAVEDGVEAVAQATAWMPDLIWMDIRLPRLDGYSATQRIKAAKLCPDPVVIALTASAFEDEQARALGAGCDYFVRKPFQPDDIFEAMARYLPVRYHYKPAPEVLSGGTEHQPPQVTPVSQVAAALGSMPQDWRQALRKAAMRGSDDQIMQVVQRLPPEQVALAETLTTWAQNFQFDPILELLQDGARS